MSRVGAATGRSIIETVDVGQQHQKIGADHGGDARGQPIVVAVTNFVGGHGVVLVDHRHGAPLQQAIDGGTGVEIAPPLLGIAERHQHLAGGNGVPRQRFGPGPRQRDLAHGGGALAVFKRELARGQFEHGAAECNGA